MAMPAYHAVIIVKMPCSASSFIHVVSLHFYLLTTANIVCLDGLVD